MAVLAGKAAPDNTARPASVAPASTLSFFQISPIGLWHAPARERDKNQPGPEREPGVREMGSLHVPRLAWPPRATLRRSRRACAALAVAALTAVMLVNGTQHPAYGATEGPYGGTPAAVPGTVQAANYDTGGQGTAYNGATG